MTGGGGTTGGGTTGGGAPTCDFPAITMNTTFNRDLRVVTISGTLTVNGAAMPDSPLLSQRGSLTFTDRKTGDTTSVPILATGPATFSTPLFAGNYDVSFSTTNSSSLVGLPPGLVKVLVRDQLFNATTTFNRDLTTITVSGALTVNNAQMPDSPLLSQRGSLTFLDRDSGDSVSVPILATGAASFSTFLFAGSYDVSFSTTNSSSLVGLPPGLVNVLVRNQSFAATTTFNRNLTTVTITGALTVNNAQMPDSPLLSQRGSLTFLDRDSGDSVSVPILATGAASFSTFLFAGSYDVSFSTTNSSSLIGMPPGLVNILVRNQSFAATSTFNRNLTTVTITGALTVNNAQMPDSPLLSQRGSLTFLDRVSGDSVSVPILATGAASFSTFLFAGSYDVSFSTTNSSSLVGMPPGLVNTLVRNQSFAANGTFNRNLTTVTVTGALSVNGAQMPDSPLLSQRGSLTFLDRDSGDSVSVPILATGIASFSTFLFAGSYDLSFSTTNSSSLVGMPPGSVTRLVANRTFSANAMFTHDLTTVTVTGTLTMNGAQMPDSPLLSQRGSLVFRDRLSGDTVAVPILATGAASFSTFLFAGSYNVTFSTTNSSSLVGLPPGSVTQLATGCLAVGSCTASAADLTGAWTFIFDDGNYGVWNMALTEMGGQLSGGYSGSFSGQVTSGQHSGPNVNISVTAPGCDINLSGTLANACELNGVAVCVGFSQSLYTAVR